jgi:hypothetical protein
MRMRAVKNDMLLILDIIFSFTQITSRGGPGVPCHSLTTEGVDTQSETGNTANDICGRLRVRGKGKGYTAISASEGS